MGSRGDVLPFVAIARAIGEAGHDAPFVVPREFHPLLRGAPGLLPFRHRLCSDDPRQPCPLHRPLAESFRRRDAPAPVLTRAPLPQNDEPYSQLRTAPD